MNAFLREPLLHFLLLGIGLFLLSSYIDQGASKSDPQVILVDRERLLTFLQYRTRAFRAADVNAILDALPEEALQRTIQDYVREEALYREAKALQLDRNDYVSRLRLIQQLEFTLRGFSEAAAVQVTDSEAKQYYDTHHADFYEPARVTFSHVFLSSERRGAREAESRAESVLQTLNRLRVRFDQAPGYGDRFLYHVNYVDRVPEEIASHFGQGMQEQLFALQPSDKLWRGPFRSPYGFHLVLLSRNARGYLPSLADVRAKVEQAAGQAKLEAQFEASIQSVVGAYKVKISPIQDSAHQAAKGSR